MLSCGTAGILTCVLQSGDAGFKWSIIRPMMMRSGTLSSPLAIFVTRAPSVPARGKGGPRVPEGRRGPAFRDVVVCQPGGRCG